MTTEQTTVRVRIFQEPTGYFFCSDDLDYLDARGTPYPTRVEATRAAIACYQQAGLDIEYITGSGASRSVAREHGIKVKR